MGTTILPIGLSYEDVEQTALGNSLPPPILSISHNFIFDVSEITEFPGIDYKQNGEEVDFYLKGDIYVAAVSGEDQMKIIGDFVADKCEKIHLPSERIMIPNDNFYEKMAQKFYEINYRGITPEILETAYHDAMDILYTFYCMRGTKRGFINGTISVEKGIRTKFGDVSMN